MEEEILVVIVDDHEIVRTGLRKMLNMEEGIRVVADYSSAREALARLPGHSPDVVLMDVKMPGMDGLEATRQLCAQPSGCRVIILTMFEEYMTEAFEAGAAGYLRKDIPAGELAESIRRIVEGGLVVSSGMKSEQTDAPAPTAPEEDEAELATAALQVGALATRATLQLIAPGGAVQAMRFISALTEQLEASVGQSGGGWDDGTLVQIALNQPTSVPALFAQLQRLPQVEHVESRPVATVKASGLFGHLRRPSYLPEEPEIGVLVLLKDVQRVHLSG